MLNRIVVNATNAGIRLDAYVLAEFPNLSRSHIKTLIADGLITLNEKKCKKAGEKVKENDIVCVDIQEPKKLEVLPENIDIDIIYEDKDLAVINKPKGLVVHPANGNANGTLVNALLYHLKNLSGINGVIRPGIVHRLDKDTSGLLLIAKNDVAHISLAKQIENKSCHRYYVALCKGNFKNDCGVIKTGYGRSLKDRKQMSVFPLGEGKVAETHYKVLERFGNYTLVEFKLQTGRTHQIRVHCKYINHPIIGDDIYGVKDSLFSKVKGQLLHAYKIEFTQPTTKQPMCFEIPYSNELQKCLKKLRNGEI